HLIHTTVRTGPYTAVREVTLTRFDQGRETERFEVDIGEPAGTLKDWQLGVRSRENKTLALGARCLRHSRRTHRLYGNLRSVWSFAWSFFCCRIRKISAWLAALSLCLSVS